MESRDLDIVVFGATGLSGRLLAERLVVEDDLRIGLAGRSPAKLEQVRASLGPRASEWPLIVADAFDPDALRSLAERARVVATTAGPYRKYGLGLVQACAEAGTDYVDITGEIVFMRESIDLAHERAERTGARIVHACGFDSIPSDLGVLLLHQASAADGAGDLDEATLLVRTMGSSLGLSLAGGPIDTAKTYLDDVRSDEKLRELVEDPYTLSPDRGAEPDLGDESELATPRRERELGTWVAPFVMEAINARVVRRSNALQGWAYGRRFRYREAVATGGGPMGAVRAGALTASTRVSQSAMSARWLRPALDRILPAPGEGPSREERERGSFEVEIHARTASGARYRAFVGGAGDPGYGATSLMVATSAICLIRDRDTLPQRAGVLTPATGLGDPLVRRLRAAGQTYDVASTDADSPEPSASA